MQTSLVFTEHSIQRMASRGLKESDVFYIYEHGKRFFAGGVLHIFLGINHIPEKDRKFNSFTRLEGTTVLIDSQFQQTVITEYRNRESTRKDRRKTKYNKSVRPAVLPLAN